MSHLAIWIIAALAICGILIRPWRWPEYIWACLGAALLVILRLLSPGEALYAVWRGTGVYLFLAGMMLLAEMARRQGLFDWLASHAVNAAGGSPFRLLSLVYSVGILVTALLSNDATAVVLTPAVYAAVKKSQGPVLPYLFSCAFVANAASFVLPISNPANLVIFGSRMPPLFEWLRFFALPSLLSISTTYVMLRLLTRRELKGAMRERLKSPELSKTGRTIAIGILATAAVLLTASALDRDLGPPTFISGVCVFLAVVLFDRTAFLPVLRGVSWGVLLLVAGLFVLVQGLATAGAVDGLHIALHTLASWPAAAGPIAASFGIAALCNVANNLPIGLLVGSAVQDHVAQGIRNALVIGVDLGPNFSITGSLATILWLIALRREGEHVTFFQFLRYGLLVTTPALALATLSVLVSA